MYTTAVQLRNLKHKKLLNDPYAKAHFFIGNAAVKSVVVNEISMVVVLNEYCRRRLRRRLVYEKIKEG